MTTRFMLPVVDADSRFAEQVAETCASPLCAENIETIQANIGLRCNLACKHCHVESSPKRTEEMSWATMQAVLDAAHQVGASTLDVTGGAPEMHPRFCQFVSAARKQGLHVMVRTNLTVLLLDDFKHMPEFLADHRVHLVASLPCYLPTNVDRQRGRHVYRDSVAALQVLNRLGYGKQDDLRLDLIYNPLGPQLPPDQQSLEDAYRAALAGEFGITFHRLYALANLPIGRFHEDLARQGKADSYLQLLIDHFNPETVGGLMCRHQLHVGWDGTLYDCDFNYALGLPMAGRPTIHDWDAAFVRRRPIVTGRHCYGCTAGKGSSCSGALVD